MSHLFPLDKQPLLPVAQRKYLFNYVASTNTADTRKALRKIVEDMNSTWAGPLPIYQHYTQHWSGGYQAAAGYLPPNDWRAVVTQSVFTLAPFGHAMETFRMWEALESGSIPVIQKPYLDPKCGRSLAGFMITVQGMAPPFVIVEDWKELPALMAEVLKNVSAYQERQDRLIQWYRAMKDEVYGTIWRNMRTVGLQRL